MFEAFLVTTSSEGLQPLGSAPQRSFELVTHTLKTRLGAAHANLLAEPVAAEHGDMIDWYAPINGTAVPLPDLSTPDQAHLRETLGTLVADITSDADTLGNSAKADDQRLAEALRNAVEIPQETMIYAVRGEDGALHPVLVHWAWIQDAQTAVRGILTAMVPRPAPLTPSVAPERDRAVPRAVWWWLILLGWLLLAAMLSYILYLMIAPCALNPGRFGFCPKPAPAISAIPGERQVIEDEISILRHELALLDRACKPVIPILPAKPGLPKIPLPVPPQQPDKPDAAPAPKDKVDLSPETVERKITERGAARGVLNFALAWGSVDDVDLSVTCPTAQTISYKNRSDCSGTFDLDANVKRAEAITDPVENIVFQELKPGVYKVTARLKSNRTDGVKPVTLHVLRRDGRSQTYSGTVSDKAPEWSVNISISR